MSFLNAIKEALSAKAPKAEVVKDAKVRTQEYVKAFSDVAKNHPAELTDAANKLYSIEIIKDKATEKATKEAEARKAKERLVVAVESITDQIGVIAEEVLCLEDSIIADKEATKVAEERANDSLNTLKAMDARTALAAARAERARKAADKPEAPKAASKFTTM